MDTIPNAPRGVTTMRIRYTTKWKRVMRVLERLGTNPISMLAPVVHRILLEGVVSHIRRDFMARLSYPLEIEVDRSRVKVRHNYQKRRELLDRLMRRLVEAQISGASAEQLGRIERRLDRAFETTYRDLNVLRGEQPNQRSGLSSGLFRQRLLHIFALLTGPEAFGPVTQHTRGGVALTAGIGPQAVLNRIYTPSATTDSRWSPSPYKVLWRHAEFGTGVYGRDPAARTKSSQYAADGDGSWFYNPPLKYGFKKPLKLHGSHGMHVLWNQQGQLHRKYADSVNAAFKRHFVLTLTNLLSQPE